MLLLFSAILHAQDARVSAETPSRDSAILLLDEVWDDLPDEGVVVYFDCAWPDCHGQVPDWFEQEGWAEGLIAGGLELRSEDVGLSPEVLEELWQVNHDHPPIFAVSLAERLADSEANALLYVRPRVREHRLDLSWEIHRIRSEDYPLRGRIILRPLPPPLPDFTADLVPWRAHRSVWVGAGLLAVGGGLVSAAVLTAEPGAAMEAGQMLMFTGGWASAMGGATLMALPALRRY